MEEVASMDDGTGRAITAMTYFYQRLKIFDPCGVHEIWRTLNYGHVST
jgi:hypothetical protein